MAVLVAVIALRSAVAAARESRRPARVERRKTSVDKLNKAARIKEKEMRSAYGKEDGVEWRERGPW